MKIKSFIWKNIINYQVNQFKLKFNVKKNIDNKINYNFHSALTDFYSSL